jgi:hypothetical protein
VDEESPRGSSFLTAHLKVFPKGLPATEAFDVVFEAGSRRTP